MAIAHGASIPLLAYLLGELTRLFIGQFVTNLYVAPLNVDPTTTSLSVNTPPNISFNEFSNSSSICSNLFPVYGVTVNVAAPLLLPNDSSRTLESCTYLLVNTSTFSDIVTECYSRSVQCLDDADFTTKMNRLAAVFGGIAVGILICGILQLSLFQVASERQIIKMKLKFFSSLLAQNIEYFDIDDSGKYLARVIV